ncbi:hypothetical protein AB0H81_43120, partial [Nonomuraea sp. NPDC050691]
FVAERGDALLRYGYMLAGNPHDAADLVQEAPAPREPPGRQSPGPFHPMDPGTAFRHVREA